MKKNFYLSAFFVSIILVLMTFISCESTDNFSCPYIISNPHVEIGECEDKYKFAGLHFGLFNDSDKEISSFTVSFMLYDSDGKNPFTLSNCIVSKCLWPVRSGSLIDFVVDLDSYISLVPDEPYQVDGIYIREIRYSDGSSWKDPYGMFCIREEFE